MRNTRLLLAFLCSGLFVFALTIILLDNTSDNIWLVESIIRGLGITLPPG